MNYNKHRLVNAEQITHATARLSQRELLTVKVDPIGKPFECHRNVRELLMERGGIHVCGWKFQRGRFPFNLVLACLWHSIWQSPDGELIDPTPNIFHVEGDGGRLYFLPSDQQPVVVDAVKFMSGVLDDGIVMQSYALPLGIGAEAKRQAQKYQRRLDAAGD